MPIRAPWGSDPQAPIYIMEPVIVKGFGNVCSSRFLIYFMSNIIWTQGIINKNKLMRKNSSEGYGAGVLGGIGGGRGWCK